MEQIGDPAEDLAWPMVRAWRFGVESKHLGGIGEVGPYLERYNAATGRRFENVAEESVPV